MLTNLVFGMAYVLVYPVLLFIYFIIILIQIGEKVAKNLQTNHNVGN